MPNVATANSVGDISNPGTNAANFGSVADWNGQNGNVTTVGSAGAGSESYYGTCDQGGNVFEWTERIEFTTNRGFRGGSWFGAEEGLRSSWQSSRVPTGANMTHGFRVASPVGPIPTVSTWGMGAMLLMMLTAGTIIHRKRVLQPA